MGARPINERVAEVKEKRERMKKRMEQYDEEIKRLEKQEAEETRKQRTHMLILCGAELSALFGKVLTKSDIHAVVNFLREQLQSGAFSLEQVQSSNLEDDQEPQAVHQGQDEISFNEFFGI